MIGEFSKKICVGMACCMVCGGLYAQDNGFDLSSQRSEVQHLLPVPGRKIDHGGIIINPTPQQITVDKTRWLDAGNGFRVKDKHHKFADIQGIPTSQIGVKLSIDFGKRIAAKKGVKPLSGAYVLQVEAHGVSVWGYDERGAFYGLQTLRQLLESPACRGRKLPYIEVNDYPALPNRGVVEGFYGTPWSHEVRLSLIDFYGRFKMNTYLYGPKDDPYHSCPNWRLPYPEKEAANIRQLVDACNRNRVDFVWAIHPGQDIKWNEEDYRNLVNKFNLMYDLGVRHFAIFFDDISGEGTDPMKQTALLNRLTEEFVKVKKDVSPLTVCPTDYSRLWANPSENGSLAIYGRTLDPAVKVFWTGDVVCSDLTRETLDWVDARIKRPAYYWWNYPVTDYARHILLQGPVYGLDTTLTDQETCGVVSNPMEHGEASKLALYGVADYAWNVSAYNAIDNWERGLQLMMPEAADAYRTFAIHSSDTENGYRRDESWETSTFSLAKWTDQAADALEKEFERVAQAPASIESGCTNRALVEELRPWLDQFALLGKRGKNAIELARMYRSKADPAAFWAKFVQNKMSDADRKAYEAHKSGTLKLQPFYENMMDDMAFGFLEKLSGEVPMDYRGIGSFASANTVQTKLMLDGDTATYFTSGISQKAGDWIGLDLRAVREVKEVSILQGRNSKDDVDYFDHAVVECSADGRAWTPLLPDLKKQYVIRWEGAPVMARYVRLRRLESERKNYAAIREFSVNRLDADSLGFAMEASDRQAALALFDKNLNTDLVLDGTLSVGVKKGVKAWTLFAEELEEPLRITQYDAAGKILAEVSVNTLYTHIEPLAGAAKVSFTGKGRLCELIER